MSCERCPRLREHCQRVAIEKKRAYRDEPYWGRPVTGFGDPDARLLLVGLAPAAHGANRTGRVFTGDGTGGSGDFLMAALHETGFANLTTSARADDGLELRDVFISMAVRCAPPENKPLPDEIARCLDHLDAEVSVLPRVQVVVALGKIAFDAWLQILKRRGVAMKPRPQFAHGSVIDLSERRAPLHPSTSLGVTLSPSKGHGAPRFLVGCYHPSRQNTNTGRLTPRMMEDVFRKAKGLIRARA